MLTEEIAREIVKETMTRLNRNINIMDEKGIIIASGDSKRIYQTHSAAKEVIKTGEAVIVQAADVDRFQGALPGVNLPIMFDGKIVGVLGITGNLEDIREFAELVKMSTEMMLRQAIMQERTEWKQHMREVAFNELVTGEFEQESLARRLRLLGIELSGPFQVAVAEVNLEKIGRSELLQHVGIHFGKSWVMSGYLNVHRIFILGFHIKEDRFKEKLQGMLRDEKFEGSISKVGLGSIAAEENQVRYAYEEALCALKLGFENTLVSYAEIEVKALLNRLNERARKQFADRVLGVLTPKLIETIETFASHDLNIGKCADAMFVHRNSLNYRLKKIQELTGYDPRIFHDAMTLQLAIWTSRMGDNDF